MVEMGAEVWNRVLAWLASHGLRILLIVIVSVVALRLLRFLVRRVPHWIQGSEGVEPSDLAQRVKTLQTAIRGTGALIILVVAGLMVLRELGLDITPLLTSMGLVGLALSLGAQTLVKDIIGGLFILIEDQFDIGDSIRVGDLSGTVERMTLRATHIRAFGGELHIIPNGEIRTVSNLTRAWSRAVVEVPLSPDEDVARAMEVLEQIGRELAADPQFSSILLEPPVVSGIEALDGWTVRLRIAAKTLPGQHWGVMRVLRRRINDRFQREGIRLGFRPGDVLTKL